MENNVTQLRFLTGYHIRQPEKQVYLPNKAGRGRGYKFEYWYFLLYKFNFFWENLIRKINQAS